MQKKCRECGAEIPNNAKYCVKCGAKVPTKTVAEKTLKIAKTATWKAYMLIICVITVWCVLGVSCNAVRWS